MRTKRPVPARGELYYRGYNVRDIVAAVSRRIATALRRFVYLLLMGKLPCAKELAAFTKFSRIPLAA
jgi:citrate synthase